MRREFPIVHRRGFDARRGFLTAIQERGRDQHTRQQHALGGSVRQVLRAQLLIQRVQIGPLDRPAPNGGSRLEGTIAEIVYLGMYTQFHVETRAGRIVCHRLADESLAPFTPGSRVAVSWEPEHASVLGNPPASA